MKVLLCLLAAFGLAFLVKESDGPWGVMAWLRNRLVSNKYVGVFFFKLLDCYFCTGCWTGLAIYLLESPIYRLNHALVWALSGGAVSLILDGLLTKLRQ